MNTDEIIRQLTANAEAIRALLQSISDNQAGWKPDAETWSLKGVMEHFYNEERLDFRKHLKEMLADPPQAWGEFPHAEWVSFENCRQALEAFVLEREASIAWLQGLKSPNWDAETRASFGPEGDVLVMSTGNVLASWLAHDFLHLRQINELLYAWNEKQAAPYAVEYAGGW